MMSSSDTNEASTSSATGIAKLPILIRSMEGRTTKIEAKTDWTVRKLKEEYGKWVGRSYNHIMLLYKARRLNDADLLSKYNVEPDSVIQSTIRSLGGLPIFSTK
ncbi:Ubiquitin-like protein [Orchesella cincta]|uniref:Ubiquitin-like protein n=1 Tax=Orchesella cincta TaxID=48709 RepID=A0A1D2ML00_ORCCI|nr:Ubiquitin-like protein [Orchesella cincta]